MSSALNANAREWRPTGPPMVELPPSNEGEASNVVDYQPNSHYSQQHSDAHHTVFVYDSDGEGELVPHDGQFGFDGDDDHNHNEDDEGTSNYHPAHQGGYGGYPAQQQQQQQQQHHQNLFRSAFKPSVPSTTTAAGGGGDDAEDEEYAKHAAEFESETFYIQENGMPFVPPQICNNEEEFEQVDWEEEARKYMALQRQLIVKQINDLKEREETRAARLAARTNGGGGQQQQQPASSSSTRAGTTTNNNNNNRDSQRKPSANETPKKVSNSTSAAPSSSSASRKPTSPPPAATTQDTHGAKSNNNSNIVEGGGVVLAPASNSWATVVRGGPAPPSAPAASVAAPPSVSASGAPLTVNGNHRWKKMTKGQQRQQQAQKQAFESFANSLLHSASPFMGPLRLRCKTSLPHIKVDQRFGKRGVPQSAVAQFVVAPMVVNYRPRHFDELTPGDTMEFHYDFAQVLKALPTSNTISFCYGPEWKPYAIPYCYVSCRDYKQEVLSLCPQEIPNSRSEALYEDDIVKDVTALVLAVEELHGPLSRMSVLQCMSRRVNLAAMYEAFATVFAPVGNYQIQIRDLEKTPSTFLLKTSKQVLDQLENGGKIVLEGDDELWDALPMVDHSYQSGKGTVVQTVEAPPPAAAAAAPPPTAPVAAAPKQPVAVVDPAIIAASPAVPTTAVPRVQVPPPRPDPKQASTASAATTSREATGSAQQQRGSSKPTTERSAAAAAEGTSKNGASPWLLLSAFSAICIAATAIVVVRSQQQQRR